MNSQKFLDSLSDIIDYYSNVYGNHIVIGDFNFSNVSRNIHGNSQLLKTRQK